MAATKRFHVTTFGCQMNEHDSERMKGMLESLGYAEAPQRDEADLILFNTCSIREAADSRFVAHLHQAKGVKRARPDVVIGVGGCWAQSVKDDVFRQFPFVDVAFGPGQVHKLAEFLTSDSLSAQGYFEFEGFTGHLPAKRAPRVPGLGADLGRLQLPLLVLHRALHARARGVAAVRRARRRRSARQVADGAREVTLLGQNVNSYGRDLRPDRRSFAELLHALDAIDGLDRLRYTSPHPKDMREDVIRAHAELASVCEHIHLPLQSGSSAILKAMRRTYDRGALPGPRRAHPRARARLRDHDRHHRRLPGRDRGGLRADARGLRGGRLRRRLHLRLLAAPRDRGGDASPRASSPHEVKVERMERLVEVVQRRAHERAQRFVGRTLDVLVEGPSRTDASRIRGRSRHGKTVNFTGLAAPGEIVPVEIHSATSTTLAGEESLLSRAAA